MRVHLGVKSRAGRTTQAGHTGAWEDPLKSPGVGDGLGDGAGDGAGAGLGAGEGAGVGDAMLPGKCWAWETHIHAGVGDAMRAPGKPKQV